MSVYSSGSMLDSSELTIGCFPFVLLGVVLGSTMFAVTSGYAASDKVLFVREQRFLAERETDVEPVEH